MRYALLLIGLLMLAGCFDQLSINKGAAIKELFLEADYEIVKGGQLHVNNTVITGYEDDNQFYLYIEKYAGDQFLESQLEHIDMGKKSKTITYEDNFVFGELDSGKHKLTYRYWWTPEDSERNYDNTLRYVNCNGKSKTQSYLSYSEIKLSEAFTKCDPYTSDFDSSVQYSQWLDNDNDLYSYTKSRWFCIDYCSKDVETFIEKVIVTQGCQSDDDCIDSYCEDEVCIRDVVKTEEKFIHIPEQQSLTDYLKIGAIGAGVIVGLMALIVFIIFITKK